MPERICEICDNPKTPVKIHAGTFGNPDFYVETGEWTCDPCTKNNLQDERDHLAFLLERMDDTLTKVEAERDYWRGLCKIAEEVCFCEDCDALAATYLEKCKNPMHQIHDAVWEWEKTLDENK